MATLSTLADRLRAELGDTAKSFVYTAVGDGSTTRFQMDQSPVDGSSLVVKVNGVDVSNSCSIEEQTGMLILDAAPEDGDPILVSGTRFSYFTTAEIEQYVNTALGEHILSSTTPTGAKVTLSNLPVVEEYPVVILAATLALYTLATDASFDIDITAPDGVHIPRSQRYRQLMDMIQTRKEQYRELCTLLGIGMYRIEVFTLRRISRLTNRYVPVYRPQEVDDSSRAHRVRLSIPTYGVEEASTVQQYDINLYQGDSYEFTIDFPFDITGYEFLSQIRKYAGDPIALAEWTIEVVDAAAGTIKLSLSSAVTKQLPDRAFWDLQLTVSDDPDFQRTWVKGSVITERQITTVSTDPYATGWQG